MKIRITKKGLPKAQVGQATVDQAGIVFGENPYYVTQDEMTASFGECGPGMVFSQIQQTCVSQQEADAEKQALQGFGNFMNRKKQGLPTNPFKTTGNEGTASNPMGADLKGVASKSPVKAPNSKPDFTGLSAMIGLGSALTDFITEPKKQRDFDRYMRQQQMSDNLYPSVSGSRGDYVTTGTSFGMFRPDQYVVNKGMYTAQEGGENPIPMNTIRIRIVDGPQEMAYGGQSGYGLDVGQRKVFTEMPKGRSQSVSSTIGAVPRNAANIEAEGGETLYGDVDGDGVKEHMKISGPRHSQGGVPLRAPEGSFIFSDAKKMAIKDEEILKEFGLSPRPGGYTPAEIAERYDINKYKAIMEDPDADEISKSTAQHMVKNYQDKLARLAMIQEAMKDFPQGVPEVAQDLIQANQDMVEMAYGGYAPLPKAQFGFPWETFMNQSVPYTFAPGPGVNPQTGQSNATVVVQNKDPRKPPVTIKEDDIFNQQVIADLKKKGYDIKYSPRIAKGDTKVPIRQARQKSGLYGDVQMAEIAELKARHPWYFANRPKWDPTNPADVFDFQTKYDEEFAKQKGYLYFDGQKAFSKKDKKLGEYTYNAPGLDMSQPVDPGTKYKCTPNGVVAVPGNTPTGGGYFNIVEPLFNTYEEALAACKPKEKPKEDPKINPNKNTFTGNEPTPFGWMTPDMVNMFAAAALPPKKYLPYMGAYKTITPDPTFYDPNRELAANAEQANIQGQYLANFAGPQSFLANSAGLQGKAAENAANILGRYNNLNVGVANDFSVRRADTKNKEMVANVERANELYKGNVIANEQYRNAKRQYLNNIAKTFGTAWNNRMNLGLLNATNPMYNIDNISGRSYFKKGWDASKLGMMQAGMVNPMNSDYWANLNAAYMNAKSQFPDLTSGQFLSRAGVINSSVDNNQDGIPDRTTSRQTMPFGGYVTYPF
jgi:hypothetical protein